MSDVFGTEAPNYAPALLAVMVVVGELQVFSTERPGGVIVDLIEWQITDGGLEKLARGFGAFGDFGFPVLVALLGGGESGVHSGIHG